MLRPEALTFILSLVFLVGVLTGGSVADEGTTGWPKTFLSIVFIVVLVVWSLALVACGVDLFWARGFIT